MMKHHKQNSASGFSTSNANGQINPFSLKPSFPIPIVFVISIIMSCGNIFSAYKVQMKYTPSLQNEFTFSQGEESKFAIFFNTFSKINKTEHAKQIIISQLQEINSQPLLDGAALFYTRIGELDWEWPVFECRGNLTLSSNQTQRQCTEIAALPEGHENVSLQAMHQYCVRNKQDRVVYMHSKGTFTESKVNDQLRNILMKAITSEGCLNYTADGTCHTCSARFSYTPFPTYIGNMFVAECSYISKLIAPNVFEPHKQRVIAQMKNNTRQIHPGWHETKLHNEIDNKTSVYKVKTSSMFWIDHESWTGVGRYAAEHWLGSHPDLKPCEVFSAENGNPLIRYGKRINVPGFKPPKLEKIQEAITNRTITKTAYHPWFQKDARLYEYKELYSKHPHNDSWFFNLWSESKR
jgi:hypothetical protein